MDIFRRIEMRKEEYKILLYKLEEIETQGTKCTQTFSQEPMGSSGPTDKVGETACKMAELREDLKNAHKRLKSAIREGERVLSFMEPEEELVLRYRYIQGKPWKEIAERMGIKEDKAFNIRRRALKKYEKVMEKR